MFGTNEDSIFGKAVFALAFRDGYEALFKTYHVQDSHPMFPNLATPHNIFICFFNSYFDYQRGGDGNSSVNYVNWDCKINRTLHYIGILLVGMLLYCWFSKKMFKDFSKKHKFTDKRLSGNDYSIISKQTDMRKRFDLYYMDNDFEILHMFVRQRRCCII